jgi:hypothetical protein
MEASAPKSFLFDSLLPRVEWLAWLLASAGIVLAWFAVPRANVFLVLGFHTLAVVYFLDAFAPRAKAIANSTYYEEENTQNKSFLIERVVPQIQAQAMAFTSIGILFKLLFWAGANAFLLTGTLALGIVVAVQLYTNRLSRKVLLIASLGAIIAYIPSDELVRQFYRHDPVLTEKMLYHLHHPEDRAAAEEVERLPRVRHDH